LGLLAGTRVPCSGRLSVGGISPLTGLIKEANAGGTAGHSLAWLGIKAIIVSGQAGEGRWYILKINSSGAELIEDNSLLELGNYEASEQLRRRYGDKVSIILAGPASVRQYPNATVAVTDTSGIPCRHAARGGLGSVMASRSLKAIVIDDSNARHNKQVMPKEFNAVCKQWSKELITGRKVLSDYGTANLVAVVNEVGGLATRNYSSGRFEKADEIGGEKLASLIKSRGGKTTHACQYGCPIRCSNVYHDKNGRHLTSSLEFETITLTGSNLGIGDLDIIAGIDRFCDDFGLDTIELGATLGVMMEAGIIPFGDSLGTLRLLDEIRQGTRLGTLAVQGAAIAGKALCAARIPVVKGQSLAAYDPRALKGTGVTYATSPMGADHTAGNCLPGRTGYRPETQKVLDTRDAQGQIELSKDMQVLVAVCDAMGLCVFVGPSLDTVDKLAGLVSLYFNREFTIEDMIAIGKNTIRTELDYNSKSGTRPDNDLPEFFRLEPISGGLTFDLDKNELADIFKDI
jgi:aldehyde:ferredoxin oxidoreductase